MTPPTLLEIAEQHAAMLKQEEADRVAKAKKIGEERAAQCERLTVDKDRMLDAFVGNYNITRRGSDLYQDDIRIATVEVKWETQAAEECYPSSEGYELSWTVMHPRDRYVALENGRSAEAFAKAMAVHLKV